MTSQAQGAEGRAALPAWLSSRLDDPARDPYVPQVGREGFLRKNILSLAGLLARLRVGGGSSPERSSALDLLLARVSAPMRLVGTLVACICVSAATNMFFVYLMLAVVLVMLAARPARSILPVARPALVIALVGALVMVPAALTGQTSAPMRMGIKSFVTTTLVLGLSQQMPWNRLVGGLRALRVPSTVVLVVDLALKDIEILGRSALDLSDALALRSVGIDHDKTSSAAGVMGCVFLRSQDLAAQMSEAMACRGFDGSYSMSRERILTPASMAYLVVLVLMVVVFFLLEGAM